MSFFNKRIFFLRERYFILILFYNKYIASSTFHFLDIFSFGVSYGVDVIVRIIKHYRTTTVTEKDQTTDKCENLDKANRILNKRYHRVCKPLEAPL